MTPEAPKTETKKAAPAAPNKAQGKGINKSEEIRKVATVMKAKGEKPRPKTIVELLKKQGITVSSPQVSMVLKAMGFRPRKRAPNGSSKASTGKLKTTKITVEDLVKAQKLVAQFGGLDRALAALEALKSFGG